MSWDEATTVLPVGTVSTCVGCGCTDLHACEGGCWWLRVDREQRKGVCSQCIDHVDAWDAQKVRQPKGRRS